MTGILPTTSFGRRTPQLAQFTAEARTRIAAAHAPDPVHKWKLHRTLVEARAGFALPDGALTVLQALLSFHQETVLTLEPDNPCIIVYPSNRELITRAGGPSEPTLRRHLAALIAAGLIARRDSPNGKRYIRRDGAGETVVAFGFDLAPFAASKNRIEAAAAAIRAEDARVRMFKEKIALLRRDCAGALLILEDAGQDVEALAAALASLSGPTRRVSAGDLQMRSQALEALADQLDAALPAAQITPPPEAKSTEMIGNAAQNERHIQNQTQITSESEPASKENEDKVCAQAKSVQGFPFGFIVKTFPSLSDYARGGAIERPSDFVDAANLARAALGVSPDAWRDAQNAMGRNDAAIAVAAMLERADEIRSAGGYLRALTAKARAGRFATGPLVIAQMKRGAAQAAPIPR